MRKLIATLLIAFLVMSTANAAQQWDAYFVRNSLTNQTGLANALEQNDRTVLKVTSEHFVRILGNEGVTDTVNVQTFVAFLRSGRVFEVECTAYNVPGTRMYRVSTDATQTDSTWARACMAGEKWLAYRDTNRQVIPFVSLKCGNPLHPPPVRIVLEECVEVAVGFDRQTPPGIQARIIYWGGYAASACGLQRIECICQPIYGPPTAAYYAPVVGGVLRLPRRMAEELAILCVEIRGYQTIHGLAAKIISDGPAKIVRDLAKAGNVSVLPSGSSLEFRYSRS